MTAALATQDAQKARSIAARVAEVAADVAAEQQRETHRLLQACVYECASLAKQWRATVEYHSNSIADDPHAFDYRNLRDVLSPAAEKTRDVYRKLETMIAASTAEIRDPSELITAKTQIEKIIAWLETWPTNDPTQRNAARESIARGEFVSDAELATW